MPCRAGSAFLDVVAGLTFVMVGYLLSVFWHLSGVCLGRRSSGLNSVFLQLLCVDWDPGSVHMLCLYPVSICLFPLS